MSIDGVSSSSLFQMVKAINKDGATETRLVHKDKAQEYAAPIVGGKEQKRVSGEELIHAVETANKSIKPYRRRLEYSVHEKTKDVMVKIIDEETDEVIKELPPEKILDMVAKMWEMAGIIIDEKA